MCLQLWAGAVHFPDFWSNVTQRWWAKQLADFHQKMPFDGLWIDMNEASNFCTGDVCYDTGVFPVLFLLQRTESAWPLVKAPGG